MDRRAFLEVTSRAIAATALQVAPLRALSSGRNAVEGRPLFEDSAIAVPERNFPSGSSLVHVDGAALDEEFVVSIAGNDFGRLVAVREETATVENFRFSADSGRSVSTLTRKGPLVAGLLETPQGRYAIRPLVGSWHLLVPVGSAPLTCHEPITEVTNQQSVRKRTRAVRSGPPVETVTVRIGLWFHNRFATYVGGIDNAKLLCESIAATENTILRETRNTFFEVELAIAELVDASGLGTGLPRPDYSEALDIQGAIDRFCNDPYIQTARGQHHVSMAGYIDRSTTIGQGGAYVLRGSPFSRSGMWACEWGRGGEDICFHEMGHTFGLNHDRSAAPAGETPYSYGFLDCEHRVHCLMSATPCFAWQQLLYSNPLHLLNESRFGSIEPGEESDAARVIRENRHVIRDFWQYAPETV